MAIRQTLAWAGLHPNDTSCLEYAEPTCLRLVEQARAIAGENAEMLAVLDQVEALLRTLAEQAPEDRMDLLEALFDTLELVVPAEFADPKQRPRRGRGRGRGGRRDRGRRKSRLIDPSEHDRGEEPEASVDAEAEHDAVANSSSPEDIVETPASEASEASETAETAEASDTAETTETAESSDESKSEVQADGGGDKSSDVSEPTPDEAGELDAASKEPADEPEGAESSSAERAKPRRSRGRERRPASNRKSRPVPPIGAAERATLPRRTLGHTEGTGAPLDLDWITDPEVLRIITAAGFDTAESLLLLQPQSMVKYPVVTTLEEPAEGLATIRGRVKSRFVRLTPQQRCWEIVLDHADGSQITCRWATRRPRGWFHWQTGREIGLVGELTSGDDGVLILDPEPVGLDGRGSGLLPMYEVDDVEQRVLRDAMADVLHRALGRIEDRLPSRILRKHQLLVVDEALRDVHFPGNQSARGRTRLAFEEVLLLQMGVAWAAKRGGKIRGYSHSLQHQGLGQIGAQLHLYLNDSQERTLSDIRRDMSRSAPMSRLLQGDVGAGKGLVAIMTAVLAAEARSQVVVIASGTLAAERRYLFADSILRAAGLSTMLVGDRPNRIEVDAIRRGEVQVVFGTESLLEESIPWKRLGLVIVESRDLDSLVFPDFSDRTGQTPDVLLVTRSPIPTSLAFTEFGGFDISVVDDVCVELANTEIYTADQRADAYAVARDLVEGGHQAFVVFPGKDGEDLLGPDDALRMAEALQADAFPGKRIGIYCSAMSREERSRVFDDFQRRRIDVLVCTTHIEDAPAVPKASVMMVEYADMYDMTRLHRLRGHVSGGRERGHCAFVLSDSPSTAGKEAVEIAQNEVDGFRLAEVDLSRRGAQAVTGKENTRPLAFRWANPAEDRILLRMARQEALQFVRNDPELKVFPHLAAGIGQLWGDWLGDALPTPQLDRPNRPRRRRRRRRRR